jgi:hypothetical protein
LGGQIRAISHRLRGNRLHRSYWCLLVFGHGFVLHGRFYFTTEELVGSFVELGVCSY